jgi:hypothetical protein
MSVTLKIPPKLTYKKRAFEIVRTYFTHVRSVCGRSQGDTTPVRYDG